MRARPACAALLATTALLGTGVRARRGTVEPCEEQLFRCVNQAPDILHAPVWALMQAGSLGAVFVAAVAVRTRDPAASLRVLAAGTSAWGGVKLVKPLIGRGRPADQLDHVVVRGGAQSGLGFPSGHVAVATTLALAVLPLTGQHRALAVAAAVTTGLARMYVGAHLPLDVVGGAAAGTIIGSVVR